VRSAIGGAEECDVHDLRVVRHEVVRGNLLGVCVCGCVVVREEKHFDLNLIY
jgi:hypothetical protein